MKHILAIGLAFLLLSCEKDDTITAPLTPETLADELALVDTSKTKFDLWAHAGNHPAFERETDNYPIHVRSFLPEGYSSFKLFLCDSINHPDSFELFKLKSEKLIIEEQGLFGFFKLKQSKTTAKLARISCLVGDSLFISKAIRINLTSAITDTKSHISISIETTQAGRVYFNWDGASNFPSLVVLSDATQSAFCAVEVTDEKFLFYNTSNLSQNFTSELRDPKLSIGEVYNIRIFQSDNGNWMRNYSDIDFIADTSGIQEFEFYND